MATRIEHAKNAENRAQQALNAVKEALKENDLAVYAAKKTALENAVDEWNANLQNVAYEELIQQECPIIAAVKMFYVEGYKVKETTDKETGKITDVTLEKRSRRIDLKKFCEWGHLDTAWVHSAAELRDLLEARETEVYSLKPSELAKKSYYFLAVMRKKESGETPDSNTQIVRLLQRVIDEAIFVDNGSGKNVYKCTNHDLAFIQDAVTKFDPKKKCSIAMLNERAFQTVMMSVFAHCLGEEITITTGAKKHKSA